MVKTAISVLALVLSSIGITLAQDVEKGAILFKQCARITANDQPFARFRLAYWKKGLQ